LIGADETVNEINEGVSDWNWLSIGVLVILSPPVSGAAKNLLRKSQLEESGFFILSQPVYGRQRSYLRVTLIILKKNLQQ
jgi:hypothetical protein